MARYVLVSVVSVISVVSATEARLHFEECLFGPFKNVYKCEQFSKRLRKEFLKLKESRAHILTRIKRRPSRKLCTEHPSVYHSLYQIS